MTDDEIERFLERADRLFGWHPKKEEINKSDPRGQNFILSLLGLSSMNR